MTKLSYFLCVSASGKENILYGTSKKEVNEVGEKMGLGVFSSVTELVLADLKTKYDEKELLDIRKISKDSWSRKVVKPTKTAKGK